LTWWCSIAALGALHVTGLVPLRTYYDELCPLMTVSVAFSNAASTYLYVHALVTRTTYRMYGSHVYDFFMGATLSPQVGPVDLKLFAELRCCWFLLALLTISAAAVQFERDGAVSASMQFMILAHMLYANAVAKGEHYVLGTWDVFYEKLGWMLTFWTFSGVPFLYVAPSVYVLLHTSEVHAQLPDWAVASLTVALLATYYVWDTSQSQKNHFRLGACARGGRAWGRTCAPSMSYPQTLVDLVHSCLSSKAP